VAADTDRPPLRSSAAWLCANLAVLAAAAGVLSLIGDSWPITLPHRGIMHALFGLLLCGFVAARFFERLRRSPAMQPCDVQALSRRLSRLVYSLLYALMFVRLIIAILHAAPDRPLPVSFEDYQGYLAWGVLALVTVHALSAMCRHVIGTPQARRRTRFSEMGG
jgi:cytochrome b561